MARRVQPPTLSPEQAHAYLAAIVESSVDAIKATTLDGTIVFWNQATERMYGYSAEEAIGRNISFVMAPERANELPEILERVARGERVEQYETERVRKDGTRLDVSISVSPIRDETGTIVGAATIARDVTGQKRVERAQRMLATASRLFAEAGLNRAVVLNRLCRAVVGTMAETCLVHLVDAPGAPLELAAALDEDPERTAFARALIAEHRLPVAEGLSGRVAATGEPLLVPDVQPEALRRVLAAAHGPLLDRLQPRSLLVVPLRAYGRTLGAVLLGRRQPGRPYTDQDLAFVRDLAERAGMALEAARVHADEERARREAEHLAAITRQIGRSLALGEVLDAVAGAPAELLDSPVAGVFLLDASGEWFDLVAGRGLDMARPERFRLPRGASIAGRVTASGRAHVVNDVAEEPAALPPLVSGESVGSVVVAPIGSRAAPLGAVEVYATTPGAFAERDAALLTALADAAGVALTNARLHQDLQQQAAADVALNAELRRLADDLDAARATAERSLTRTAFLARASAELGGSLDYETTLATLAQLAVPEFADWCAVDLVGEDGGLERLAVAHVDPAKVALARELERRYPTPPDAPTGVPAVVRTGRTEFHPDISDEMVAAGARDAEHLAMLRALGLRSAIVAPMASRGRILGALTFVSAESGRRYERADRAVAEDLARRAATAVDNALLYRAAGAARAEAEAERDRVRAVVDELPEGIVVVDAAGRVVVSNRAAAATLGRNPAGGGLPAGERTVLGTRASDGRTLAPAELPIARALTRGEVVRGEQVLLRRDSDGRDAALLVSATPLRGPEGAVSGAVAVFQDITAIRDLERERDAMLAVAAHDLKNPLGVVKGSAQLLLRSLRRTGSVAPDRLEHVLRTVEETSTRMASALDELLDATRLRMGQVLALDRRPTDLVALARGLAATYQESTEAHRIVVDAAVPELVGEWDEARIGRVLGNLLSNALKYSAGGEVRVEVAPEGTDFAVARVRDQGVGIPATELDRVFERFGRASNVGRVAGSGIGLAGARQIVEQHGGTIDVESTEGVGSTFTVRLPLHPPDGDTQPHGGTT